MIKKKNENIILQVRGGDEIDKETSRKRYIKSNIYFFEIHTLENMLMLYKLYKKINIKATTKQ